jgi:hypothetical protein
MKKLIILVTCVLSAQVLSAQLKVDNQNRVGIGTTTPCQKLHVVGNAVFSTSTSYPNSSPYIVGTDAWSTATNPSYSWYLFSNTGMYHPAPTYIGFSLGGAETMLLTPGAIKINATVDYARTLWINATSSNQAGYHMNLNGTDNFWVQANGNAWSHGSVLTSDVRLKKNIFTIDNALLKVLQLRGVTYNWIDEKSDPEKGLGLIAQEVEKVIPEVIRTSHDGTKGIEYANLVGLLVEAIKEQQAQIDELKKSQETSNVTNINTNYSEKSTKSLLFQNTPNPFNEKTEIKYFIPINAGEASIFIYNMNGVQLKEYKITNRENGSIVIEGAQLEAGIYLYSLIVDKKEIETKRMILTK